MRCRLSYGCELCVGEMLLSAGYRPAQASRARGGRSAGRRGEDVARSFLLECFAFGSRLLFDASTKQRRLTRCSVPIPRGSRSPWCVLEGRAVIGLYGFTSGFSVSCRRSRWRMGRRSRRCGVGIFFANILALPCFPRGVCWGCASRTAPKSRWLSSLDSQQSTFLQSLAIIAIPEQPRPRPAILGYTERPCRLQFMAGRVGLYSDVIYAYQRPDSSRFQAAQSRVACAKRSGRGHCPLTRFRCGDGFPWALQPAWAGSASARRFRRRR